MAFWYPFRSRQVAEITSHLTTNEELSLRALLHEHGTWWGHRVGMIAVCSVLFVDHFVHPFFVSLLASCTTMIIAAPILFVIGNGLQKREQIKQFLCSTEYARQAGYKPKSLLLNGWWL
jgi:hypothetical protein